jgi:hypothetical protein
LATARLAGLGYSARLAGLGYSASRQESRLTKNDKAEGDNGQEEYSIVAKCNDCGEVYGGSSWIQAMIPDDIWNKIRPLGCAIGCGILCISCMSYRLKAAGLKNVPVWLCGTGPLKAMQGDWPAKEQLR